MVLIRASGIVVAKMIDISERAQSHFARLLAQQGVEGMGILVRVGAPGTPAASCELEFCEPADLAGDELTIRCDGFDLHVERDSVPWMEGATMDFEPTHAGGLLNVRAPRIKGEIPGPEAGLAERVRYVLEADVNPRLAAHSGRVTLVAVDADASVVLQFGGSCHGCGMADVTLKQGVEKTLRERIPEITAVRDATDHASGTQPYYKKHEGKSAMV